MSVYRIGNKSSESPFPKIRPTLDLDFANSKTLDPRITFRRASGGTYFGPDGRLRYAGVNVPRFDHNPTTGESLGLLVEEQRTNLLLRSEEFATTWFPVAGSIASDASQAPNGTTTADQLTPANGGTDAQVVQAVTITSGATVTGSLYIKSSGFDQITIALLAGNNTTPYGSATFNASTGAIDIAAAASNGGTNASAAITPVSNGWYRASVTVTYPAVTSAGMRLLATNSVASNGDGTKGVLIWGAQLEAGALPTSYIPTTSATATRAADVASITGSAFSSWYRQDEGTVSMAYSPVGLRISYPLSIDDGTTSNFVGFGFDGAGNRFARIDTSGVTQASITQGLAVVGAESRTCMAFAINNVSASINGATPGTDLSATIPTVDRVRMHALGGSNSFAFNGTIRRLTYWPQRLPNATLQRLTR